MIKVGKIVDVTIKTRNIAVQKVIKAVIEDIDIRIEHNQTLKVRARLILNDDQYKSIKSGQSAQIIMRYNEKNCIGVPKDCVVADSNGKYSVMIVAKEGDLLLAQAQSVEIGLVTDKLVELLNFPPNITLVRHINMLSSTNILHVQATTYTGALKAGAKKK